MPEFWSGKADDSTTPDPCTYSLDSTSINNNVVRVLTVKAAHPASVVADDWCAVSVRSTTTTANTPDVYHQWLVGVRFVA